MIEGQIVPHSSMWSPRNLSIVELPVRTQFRTWPCIFPQFARYAISRSNQAFNNGMTIAVLLHG